mgnify:CR=1 FL=1
MFTKGLKLVLVLAGILFSSTFYAQKVPDFINTDDLKDIDCKCLEKEVKYNKEEQKYIDILWEESLKYLEAWPHGGDRAIGGRLPMRQPVPVARPVLGGLMQSMLRRRRQYQRDRTGHQHQGPGDAGDR